MLPDIRVDIDFIVDAQRKASQKGIALSDESLAEYHALYVIVFFIHVFGSDR